MMRDRARFARREMADTTYEIFPSTGFTVTHFLVSADIKKSLDFYSRILGGKVVMDGENGAPGVVQLENTWVVINVGGGPTDDKPNVYLAPPKDGGAVSGFMNICAVSSFMNIRVANIAECYERWKGLGAEFLTEPKVHEAETRCYMRDPDGHLIEVGEAKK
jgi:catechol 2,3-dioxygenase-like lactoylglutathione lyase family enzyme